GKKEKTTIIAAGSTLKRREHDVYCRWNWRRKIVKMANAHAALVLVDNNIISRVLSHPLELRCMQLLSSYPVMNWKKSQELVAAGKHWQMDRSWMYNMTNFGRMGIRPEFVDGVTGFVEYAKTLEPFQRNDDAFGVHSDFESGNQGEEAPNVDCKIFFEQLEAASRPLYEGCPHSQLSIVVRLLSIKLDWNVPQRAMNSMIDIMHDLVDPNLEIPDNFFKAKWLAERVWLDLIGGPSRYGYAYGMPQHTFREYHFEFEGLSSSYDDESMKKNLAMEQKIAKLSSQEGIPPFSNDVTFPPRPSQSQPTLYPMYGQQRIMTDESSSDEEGHCNHMLWGLWVDFTVCCYPSPKPSHDDANNLCSYDSMKSCRKLIEASEERRRRIIYVMSRLLDRKMKHFQDVNMFFLQIQNLSNELNAKVAAFDAQQSNYEFCDTEKALRSQIENPKREEMHCNQTFLEDATFGKEYKTEHVAIGVLEKSDYPKFGAKEHV
ncbi:hypothetical protein H5410_036221, partial [Solanum commersonii]